MLGEASDVLGRQGRGQLQELVSEEQGRHRGVQPAGERCLAPTAADEPWTDPPEGSPDPEDAWPAADTLTLGQKRPRQAPQPWGRWRVGTVSSAVHPGCAHVTADRLQGQPAQGPGHSRRGEGRPGPSTPGRCGPELVPGRATRPGAALAQPQNPCSCPARAAQGPEVARGREQGKTMGKALSRWDTSLLTSRSGHPPHAARRGPHGRPARVFETRTHNGP